MALALLGVLFVCCGLIMLHAVYGGFVTGEFIGKSEQYPIMLAADPVLFWAFMAATLSIGIGVLYMGARLVSEGLSTDRHTKSNADDEDCG